ncbi:MAG: hypothetical protein GY913_08780 [Proteobacteria bacterium]|nr:hypothetical protein [Pseudomonadota bacterium]MCP4917005.1 hypothetical protein [Pseudomonadota bacterium]
MRVLALSLEGVELSPGLVDRLAVDWQIVYLSGADPDVAARASTASPPDPLALLEVLDPAAERCLVVGRGPEDATCAREASFHTRVPVQYEEPDDIEAWLRALYPGA